MILAEQFVEVPPPDRDGSVAPVPLNDGVPSTPAKSVQAGEPASAPDPSPGPDVAALLEQAVDRIVAAFEKRSRSEAFQQKLISDLHDALNEQVSRSAVLPVVTAMMRLHEEMEKQAERLRASPDTLSPQQMLRQFEEFTEDLGLLLEQAGVARFTDEAQGDRFNPTRQQILGREPTTDADLNHRISRRIRQGADFGKTLLRREGVRVYVFEAAASGAEPPADQTAPASGGG